MYENIIEKKLCFIVKKENALNGLENFGSLMMDMQDDVVEAEIAFDIYSPENYSDEVMASSNIMETLYLLEETGVLEYDVDGQNISINMICLNYWCDTAEKKQQLLNTMNANELKYQETLKKLYDPDNIFKKKDKRK